MTFPNVVFARILFIFIFYLCLIVADLKEVVCLPPGEYFQHTLV
jgi:hypothetical protein